MTLAIKLKSTATFFLAVSYLSNLFLKENIINQLNFALLFIILIPSLISVRSTARLVGYFLFFVSAGLLITYKAPQDIWIQGLSRNLYLVVMFTLVPLLAIPIRHGGYTEALKGMFKRYTHRDSEFYLGVSLLSFFLGIMVNVGALPLMYEICQASEKSKKSKLLGTSISRGFTASIIWAPSYATTALVLELTRAKWSSIFPYGLFLGISGLLLGWINARRSERNQSLSISEQAATSTVIPTPSIPSSEQTLESPEKINWRKIMELYIFAVILIATIVIISEFTGLTTVIVVALVSLLFPLLWLIFLGKLKVFGREFHENYFPQNLPRLKNEIVLFSGAGLLSTAVMFSHLGDYVPQILFRLGGNSILFLSAAVIFTTIFLGALGIHPIVFVTIIGSTVQPAMYDISSTLLALILTSSWALATTLSPSSANVIAISGLIDHSLIEVGLKWNGAYVFSLACIVIFLLNMFHALGMI